MYYKFKVNFLRYLPTPQSQHEIMVFAKQVAYIFDILSHQLLHFIQDKQR
jgi:hypothetical protein